MTTKFLSLDGVTNPTMINQDYDTKTFKAGYDMQFIYQIKCIYQRTGLPYFLFSTNMGIYSVLFDGIRLQKFQKISNSTSCGYVNEKECVKFIPEQHYHYYVDGGIIIQEKERLFIYNTQLNRHIILMVLEPNMIFTQVIGTMLYFKNNDTLVTFDLSTKIKQEISFKFSIWDQLDGNLIVGDDHNTICIDPLTLSTIWCHSGKYVGNVFDGIIVKDMDEVYRKIISIDEAIYHSGSTSSFMNEEWKIECYNGEDNEVALITGIYLK